MVHEEAEGQAWDLDSIFSEIFLLAQLNRVCFFSVFIFFSRRLTMSYRCTIFNESTREIVDSLGGFRKFKDANEWGLVGTQPSDNEYYWVEEEE